MKTVADVQKDLTAGRFEFSRHAFKRAVERNISEQDPRSWRASRDQIPQAPVTHV